MHISLIDKETWKQGQRVPGEDRQADFKENLILEVIREWFSMNIGRKAFKNLSFIPIVFAAPELYLL